MNRFGIIGAGVASAAVAFSAQAANPPAWTKPTAPYRIGENLYFVGSAGLSSFLITTPRGHILIDSGLPGAAKSIEKSIAELGFKPRDVKILLNTHAHFDHTGGFAELKADTGAKLIASAADREALETGKYVGSEEVADYDFPPVKVDRLVKDGGTVSLGGTTLMAHLTPGHTAGCTTWTFPVKIDGVVHQAVVFCSISVAANRLVSKTRGPQYPGIVEDYRRGFAKLKSLKADVFLAPHTAQFGAEAKVARMAAGGPSPFIDPAELGVVTARYEKLFDEALATQTAAAR
jgi:metallo-beta-lactamase class B